MAEKEKVHLDKDNTCPECGRDFGRGAEYCDRCTIDEAVDPLIAAAIEQLGAHYAEQLVEAKNFSAALYDILAMGRDWHPSERVQIAAALLNSAARASETEPKVRDKLLDASRLLDRIANAW